jgi:hypothetical protein
MKARRRAITIMVAATVAILTGAFAVTTTIAHAAAAGCAVAYRVTNQ